MSARTFRGRHGIETADASLIASPFARFGAGLRPLVTDLELSQQLICTLFIFARGPHLFQLIVQLLSLV